jgi:hypothetical protein
MTTQIILHEAYNLFIFGYGKTVIDIFFLEDIDEDINIVCNKYRLTMSIN